MSMSLSLSKYYLVGHISLNNIQQPALDGKGPFLLLTTRQPKPKL